jgi:hypothetical protein
MGAAVKVMGNIFADHPETGISVFNNFKGGHGFLPFLSIKIY